jgi:hypothetical protein
MIGGEERARLRVEAGETMCSSALREARVAPPAFGSSKASAAVLFVPMISARIRRSRLMAWRNVTRS